MAEESPKPPATEYEIEHEVFSDVFSHTVTPWSYILELGHRSARPGQPDVMVARVRMPLQQAKALAIMLLRAIRDYESQTGVEIDLPAQLRVQLGIADEDWRRFSVE